jgi:hypothetical protein
MEAQDSQYAYDKPWQLTAETLANARTWWQASPPWYPPKPPSSNPMDMVPPRYGYRTTELGIADVLEGTFSRLDSGHANDAMMTDWSGQNGGYESTMRPTGAGGGGIV